MSRVKKQSLVSQVFTPIFFANSLKDEWFWDCDQFDSIAHGGSDQQ